MDDALELHEIRDDTILTEPPFPESAQLCDELESVSKELTLRNKHGQFPRQARLPGQPQVELRDASTVVAHCIREMCTPNFDQLIGGWLSTVPTNHEELLTLTGYGSMNCHIVVTENPELHCVWDDNRIFIKPIPLWLTSHAFWERIIHDRSSDSQMLIVAANGFLRSYATLITHASDFALAEKALLIPRQWSFYALIMFLTHFAPLPDQCVSKRHTVGAVQLQTLNASMFLRHGRMFHRLHRNRYNAYFTRYYGPTLFVFATFSVALSAMQVAIAVRQAEAPLEEAQNLPQAGFGGGLGGDWRHMGFAFRWFSIWSITFAASMAMILFSMFMFLAWMDGWDAMKARRKAKRKSI